LYSHFKQGGRPSQGLNKSELLLHIATQSSDPKQFTNVVLKYALGLSCIASITHMEGEEIFGSYKWKANLAPISKGDSHKQDRVNFFHPCVNHAIAKSNVQIEQHGADQIHGVVEVLEVPCGDGV
jgi:hypothetical protein